MRSTSITIVVVAAALTSVAACASDDGTGDDEDLGIEDEALTGAPNRGVNPRKVCAKLESDAEIAFHPGGGGAVASLKKGQYVLVQSSPGLVEGHYWVDPGLFGLTDAQFHERCGAKGPRPQTKQRRGWIRAGVLRAVGDHALPTGEDFTPKGDGKALGGKLHAAKVKDCALPGDVGTFGNFNGAIYLNYNTHDISGGGIAFGYVTSNDTFGIVPSSGRVDKQHPEVVWVYGKSHLMKRWGWVPLNCLG